MSIYNIAGREQLFDHLDERATKIFGYDADFERILTVFEKLDEGIEPQHIYRVASKSDGLIYPGKRFKGNCHFLDEEMTMAFEVKDPDLAEEAALYLNQLFKPSGTKFILEYCESGEMPCRIRTNLTTERGVRAKNQIRSPYHEMLLFIGHLSERLRKVGDIQGAPHSAKQQIITKFANHIEGAAKDWQAVYAVPVWASAMGIPGLLRPKLMADGNVDEDDHEKIKMQNRYNYGQSSYSADLVVKRVRNDLSQSFIHIYSPGQQILQRTFGNKSVTEWVLDDLLGGYPFGKEMSFLERAQETIEAGLKVISLICAFDVNAFIGVGLFAGAAVLNLTTNYIRVLHEDAYYKINRGPIAPSLQKGPQPLLQPELVIQKEGTDLAVRVERERNNQPPGQSM